MQQSRGAAEKTALRWKIPVTQRQRIQMVLLRESGMTQPAIAAAMGVPLSTVSRDPWRCPGSGEQLHIRAFRGWLDRDQEHRRNARFQPCRIHFRYLCPGLPRGRIVSQFLKGIEQHLAGLGIDGTISISDVFVGLRSGKTYVAIVLPVMSDGKVPYLLDLRIPTEIINSIISSQLRHPEWLIGVTGNDGGMIARNWEPERCIGQRASDGFIQDAQGDEGIFESITLDGVHVFNAYSRSKLTGWRIGTGIPIHTFRAPFYYSLLALGSILAIGLLCSAGLSYSYARVMLRPAAELRKLADAPSLETRRLPERTGIREFDTVLGMLAKSFSDLDNRDRHQQTLVDELNHRAKNTLTAIQAITRQTHRQSKSWEEFRNNFEQRLIAMARSFDLLTKNDWRSGDLREVITECSKPFCESNRIRLTGPPIVLPPKAVVAMGMIIHELATNATKYGAFSNATGWVKCNWEVQVNDTSTIVYFHWKEHGGPPVTETEQKGFGSSLIASTIETELHGKAETKREPDGLYFCASFPIESMPG